MRMEEWIWMLMDDGWWTTGWNGMMMLVKKKRRENKADADISASCQARYNYCGNKMGKSGW
jgi:hypothetical protein